MASGTACTARFSHANFFPPELLTLIFEHLVTEDLPSVLLVSSAFYTLGYCILYRYVTCPRVTRKRILLLQTLVKVSNPMQRPHGLPNPALAVQVLHINFHANTISSNLLRLIQRALKEVTNLNELQFELSSVDNYHHCAWCLSGTSFQLRTLHTSLALDNDFETWINAENQRSIEELSFRGHPKCSAITISHEALPKLSNFRSVHLDSQFNTAFLRGRPVDSVALTLFPLSRLAELDSLSVTSTPVKRLTALCLEDECSHILISEIATRLPELESLHVVLLSVAFSDVCIHCSHAMTLISPL